MDLAGADISPFCCLTLSCKETIYPINLGGAALLPRNTVPAKGNTNNAIRSSGGGIYKAQDKHSNSGAMRIRN